MKSKKATKSESCAIPVNNYLTDSDHDMLNLIETLR